MWGGGGIEEGLPTSGGTAKKKEKNKNKQQLMIFKRERSDARGNGERKKKPEKACRTNPQEKRKRPLSFIASKFES